MPGGSGPNAQPTRVAPGPAGMAGAACTGAAPDGASTGADALGRGLTTPPLGGARLIAGGVGADGIGAGGIGGPKIELPHCAEPRLRQSTSAAMNKAACRIRQAPVSNPQRRHARHFDRNRGYFKPVHAVCHPLRPMLPRHARGASTRSKMPEALDLLKTRRSVKAMELAGPGPVRLRDRHHLNHRLARARPRQADALALHRI